MHQSLEALAAMENDTMTVLYDEVLRQQQAITGCNVVLMPSKKSLNN